MLLLLLLYVYQFELIGAPVGSYESNAISSPPTQNQVDGMLSISFHVGVLGCIPNTITSSTNTLES